MTGLKYELLYFSLMLFFLALIIVIADSLIVQKKAQCFFGLCWIPGLRGILWQSGPESARAPRKQETCLLVPWKWLPFISIKCPLFAVHERVHWWFSLLLSCPFLFLSVSKRNKSQLSDFSTNESESFLSSFPNPLYFCRQNNQSHLCSAGGKW